MISSPLCELLGIEYPIIQGGMAWIADASLASAVSNAGGLGLVSAMNAGPDWVRDEIRKTREMTEGGKPFGLNIMLMSPHVEEVAKIVIEEKVPVVTTGAGNPSKYLPAWIEAGIKVLPVVPSTGIAKVTARAGASALIAEGGESGGHIGELTTMALVPQVCDAVDIPVIAAGGIADGRQLCAALMLGAVGVQIGTRFLVARECTVHQTYKDKILKARDIDTITTGKRLGHPVRSLRTPFSRAFFEKEYDTTISNEELEAFGVGSLRFAAKEGDEKRGSFLAGQIASMITREQSAREIIVEMFTEAEEIMRGASKWVK